MVWENNISHVYQFVSNGRDISVQGVEGDSYFTFKVATRTKKRNMKKEIKFRKELLTSDWDSFRNLILKFDF